jgi:hypothetical protein
MSTIFAASCGPTSPKCDRFCQLTSPAHQTNECLVHQRGRLQQVSGPLGKRAVCESAQLASTSGTSWSRAAASPCLHATAARDLHCWGTAPDDKVCLKVFAKGYWVLRATGVVGVGGNSQAAAVISIVSKGKGAL